MPKSNIITGLDLGTTKVACVIAEIDEDEEIRIKGVGTSPSEGLRKGVVVNLERTVDSIKRAVSDAELMSGVKVSSLYAGIAGDHTRSMTSRGVIAVSSPGNEIKKSDVDRVVEQAKAVSIPIDREIIHVIPQEFIVDDQSGIKNPKGMSGVRLEAEVHIVTGAVSSAANIYKSIERAGFKVKDIVLQPLASSYAVLDTDEKEIGVALIDIGGGTTDIAIFHEGSLKHTQVIGLGGVNVTNDIAFGLRTPRMQAEHIKTEYGCALASLIDGNEKIKVEGVGGRGEREVPRVLLCDIVEPRMEEIFSISNREIKKTDYADLLGAGIVLTGGTAKLTGMVELAEEIFDMPAKIGIPEGISGLVDAVRDPVYSTGVGLVIYGYKNMNKSEHWGKDDSLIFDKIWDRMKRWFGNMLA